MKSNRILLFASIMTSFIIVYLAALLGFVWFEQYSMPEGITDLNYVVLSIALSVPCIVYLLMNNKREISLISTLIKTEFISYLVIIPVLLGLTFEISQGRVMGQEGIIAMISVLIAFKAITMFIANFFQSNHRY
ncbi:hypothetical protein [Pontibacillus litoralis]|uniref:Uncharacterized protein n=1 Tax=Pontibacillus litoralis JSM 072002 TaxID=1385512 RepID=A0A0A5HMR9_9BACI|nr:hypothetical protein [Pontibacillus litoralis]KGX84912.1 hypothetical protein N784_11610 [Pontibacillus litoralis JSM 072002]